MAKSLTPPDDNVDENLMHDKSAGDTEWADFIDSHTSPTGSVRANGRTEASDLPVSARGGQGPLVDDSGHITAADNAYRGKSQSGGGIAKQAAKQAISGGGGGASNATSAISGAASNKDGKPQGVKQKAADAASDAAQISEAAATIESPTAWLTLAKQAKKHWKGLGLVLAIALVPIFILVFVVFYALANPTDFLYHVAQSIGYKETALTVGKGVYNWITKGSVTGMLPGEVEYHGPNTAVAAPNANPPKPGSFADKVSKIDWSKAQYQTQKVVCPYSIHTKQVTDSSGSIRSVVDYIAGPDGQPASGADPNAVASCIQQRYPILNTLMRQPETRTINFQVGLHLNYATPNDQLPQGDTAKQDNFFRDKTLNRVQDQENKTTSDNQQVTDAIKKASDLLQQGKSPDQITFQDIGYQLPPDSDPNKQRALALCDFGNVLLTPKNIGESIWSRANADRRAAYKIATLSSTGKYHLVSSEENNATINSLANWADSYAYQNEVNGVANQGENIDPEAIHNRAIGADQVDQGIQSILTLQQGCKDLKDNANFTWGNAFANLASIFHLPWGSSQAERDAGAIAEINKFYDNLAQQISANSNGVFPSPTTVTVEQVILRMVRIGSNVTVSGVEGGPQDFNRQAMGYRQNAFDNMLAIGGRFLTDQEAATSSVVAESTQRSLDKQKGLAWRLFSTENTRSLASNFMGVITNPPKIALVKSLKFSFGLLNPINLFKTINDNTSYLAFGETNRAMAATDSVDQYFQLNPAGFTDAELATNPTDVANYIENIKDNGSDDQKAALAQYDTCFKTEVTNQLFLYGDNLNNSGADKYKADFKYAPDEIKSSLGDPNGPNCAELYSPEPASQGGNRQELIKNYRLYRYNMQTVTALDYLSNPDVEDPSLNANAANKSLSSAGSTIDPNLPSGSDSELIQQINDTHNVTLEGGASLNGLKNTMLAVFLRLAQNYKIHVSSTVRPKCNCPHANGSAMDLDQINGTSPSYSSWDPNLQKFENDAANLLPNGSWMGFPNNQYKTNTLQIATPRGVTGDLDPGTGPHFHLNVPGSAP